MGQQYVIAIDGPTASGKGTVARMLARNLGISCLDTGAMYRAVGMYFLDNKIDHNDPDAVTAAVQGLSLDVKCVDGQTLVYNNGIDVTPRLYDLEISSFTPVIARVPEVRVEVRKIQKAIAKEQSLVIEGRDITSVVFPNARFKFYLDAQLDARSYRRHKQEVAKGVAISYDQVRTNIFERDRADMTRPESPLIRVKDAIMVNATKKSALQVVAEMELIIKRQLKLDEKREAKKARRPRIHPDFRRPFGATAFRLYMKLFVFLPYHLICWQRVFNRKELKQHRGKPVIFAIQHRSNSDVASIFMAFTTYMLHFIGKESLFKPRTFLNWFLRSLNGFPIRPGNDLAVIRHSLGILKKKQTLVIFPEGRRNFNPEDALAVRNGAAVIAMKSGAPIVPIVTRRAPRPFRFNAFKIGATIWPEKCADKNEMSSKLKESMSALLEGFEYTPKPKKWERMSIENSRGIVFINGKLLVIKRVKEGETFYVLPGGHTDPGETPREAIVREIKEECNVDTIVTRELYRNVNNSMPEGSRNQACFLCEYRGGTVSKTDFAEEYQPGYENKIGRDGKPRGTREPMLIDVSEIAKIDLRPACVKKQLLKDTEKYGIHLTRATKYLK